MKPTQALPWSDVKRWLPGVLISLVALLFIFQLAKWGDLSAAFGLMQPLNLALAVLISIASLGVRSLAWRALLANRARLDRAFWIINQGYLLNNLLPFKAGEVGRAALMGKDTGLGPFHVLSSIVIERVLDLAFAAGLFLMTLPLALGMQESRPVAILTLILVLSGLTILFLMARYNQAATQIITRLGSRWGWFRRWVVPQLAALLNGLGALAKPGYFFSGLGWIAISWGLWVVVYYVMLLNIAPQAPFWWAIFLDAALALGAAIPSAPGSLGVYEAAVVGALTVLGISPSTALAYAIVMHLMQFAITGVFGLLGLYLERSSLSGLIDDIRLAGKTLATESQDKKGL